MTELEALPDRLTALLLRLCERILTGPEDTRGLKLVEDILNQAVIQAGAEPPEPFRLWFGELDYKERHGEIVMGFQSDYDRARQH